MKFGKWKVYQSKETKAVQPEKFYIITDSGGSIRKEDCVCSVIGKDRAKMIAASTTLFKACEIAIENLKGIYPHDHIVMKTLNDALKMAGK